MKPRRIHTPSLRYHKASSRGIVTLNGRDHYLSHWPAGASKPPAAVKADYSRVIAEWLANNRQLPTHPILDDAFTVADLLAPFWEHVQNYYRRNDGSATSEVAEYRYSLRPLVHLYADLPAAEFSPLKLKAVRQLMIDGYTHPDYGDQEPLSRKLVNKRIGRIVAAFKWGAAEDLVPATIYHTLKTVDGLKAGRTGARETEEIKPVSEATVEAVLPFVSAEIAAMIQLQRLTGMRPGEVCGIRATDIDMAGAVWIYRPPHHKMAYRNKARAIAIGPRGQAIVKEFLQINVEAYLFSPLRARERWYASMRAKRKSKVQPSQQCRRKSKPKKLPRDRYSTATYCQAVSDACDRAFPAPGDLGRRDGESKIDWMTRLTAEQKAELSAWQKQQRWHPNQLRHAHATEVRRQFGLEAAQVSLGHSQAGVTQMYAERDQTLAAKVALAIG